MYHGRARLLRTGESARVSVAHSRFAGKGGGTNVKRRLGKAFWIESVLGSVTTFLALLTLIWPDRIEGVFGVDPDHGNGSFEWAIVAVCFAVTIASAVLAGREWRRAASASAA